MSGALLLPMWDYTQSLPILILKNKTMWAWLPKADKQLVWEITPQKGAFEGSAHQEYCSLWGGVGLAWPCPGPDTCMVLLPLCRARLYHYYTCVVVVHSCLRHALIRHEWGASLADVGLHSKSSHVACRTKLCGLDSPKWTNSLCGKLPHNNIFR